MGYIPHLMNPDILVPLDIDTLYAEEYDSIARRAARVLDQKNAGGRNTYGDHMITAEPQHSSSMVSPVRTYYVALAMGWVKFMGMSDAARAKYLSTLIDVYHANSRMLADMFGVEPTAVELEIETLNETGNTVTVSTEDPRTESWDAWFRSIHYRKPRKLCISHPIVDRNRHHIAGQSIDKVQHEDLTELSVMRFEKLLASMGI